MCKYFCLQDEAKQKYIAYVDSLVGPTESSTKPDKPSDTNSTSATGFDVSMDGRLKIIKLNKPEKKNAFSLDMYITFAHVKWIVKNC